MLISFLRSLILYIVVIFGMRIMGKRQLGQLQPSELVVTILISNIATLPIENSDVPLILGIVPILTLMCFEVILSVCTLKSTRLRKLVWGNTRVLIQNGRINQQELSDLRYSVDDLMEQLRANGIFDLRQVEFVLAETNGQLRPGMTLVIPETLGGVERLSYPVAGEGETLYTVKAGDTLSKIAQSVYGDMWRYQDIFERNSDRLKNANTIYEGQVIVLPQ